MKFSLAMRQGYAQTTLEQAFGGWFSHKSPAWCMCPNMAVVRAVNKEEWSRLLEEFQDSFISPYTYEIRYILESSDLAVEPFEVTSDELREFIREHGGRTKTEQWGDSVAEIFARVSAFGSSKAEIETIRDVMDLIIALNDVSLLAWPHIASYLERHGN